MKSNRFILRSILFFMLILVLLISCGNKDEPSSKSKARTKLATSLTIVSGSENRSLEPLIRVFACKKGAQIRIQYQGSVDIMLALAEQGNKIPYDAVWPANSLWITLGDQHKVVKHVESIMRSPVVLGVKKSIAKRLGWTETPVAVADILKAADDGQLRFAMTSATQSNSGASAYLGFLHAMAGSPDILKNEHLDDPEVQQLVKRLLTKVNRSSGSSGWLKDMIVKHNTRFQAMFNYEVMIIEADKALVSQGKEPLYAIYPTDGIMISDSPLGYVDKGQSAKEALFKELQAYLLSDDIQQKILKQGRRTGLVGLNPELVDKKVFNPDWGIDITRIISSVPTPAEPVIRRALDLYQTALRKPSCTAYVIDISGSMDGKGINELKAAMTTLLDPDQARRYFLQSSSQDIHIILPFNHNPQEGLKAKGNNVQTLNQLLAFVENLNATGGTNIYSAASKGLKLIHQVENIDQYFPAVILMTDGRSKGDIRTLKETMEQLPMGNDIPIHSITFGDADEKQLQAISEISIGRVFQGENLVKAFRKAKGYN